MRKTLFSTHSLAVLAFLLTVSFKSLATSDPAKKYKEYIYSALVTNLVNFPVWSQNLNNLMALDDNGYTCGKFLLFSAKYFLLAVKGDKEDVLNLIEEESESADLLHMLVNLEPDVIWEFFSFVKVNPFEFISSQ